MTPAHSTGDLAELVCSNSLKGEDPETAAGLLKTELKVLGSMVLTVASETRVPAGGALAVDRARFSAEVTRRVSAHPLITLERHEATSIPDGRVIVATGPLTSPAIEPALGEIVGAERLSFFDAAAPIIETESLDMGVVFAASRYGKGEGADYLNAPMTREQYDTFLDALTGAARVHEKEFERRELFAACQPVEEVARSGHDALRFGALKPVGLIDPHTGERPWAVVQLRAENNAGTAYNMVGFQTNLTFPEQARVFRLIPGLESAEFSRFGVMHRNTFIDAPRVLGSGLSVRTCPRVWLAGQLTGTEGYAEAVASGLMAALNVFADIRGLEPAVLPVTTALGSLIAYSTDVETTRYQPMHVNFGIIPPLSQRVRGKRERYAAYAARAAQDMQTWSQRRGDLLLTGGSTQ
jgi:methylenetetrahydrofolate--tRNA-(uracil-5-)-methyltransferase